ncbi:MAG TPA: cell division protein FtsZ, partial [Pseudomonadales bacterium]|nr:cell division protein FtsZ [Pseudomonadales bacterium]
FITAGMGGGTGTGGAPVVAQIARDLGILTVAVVTKPFTFEGRKRMQVAERGIEELAEHVDSLITIPNEKLQLVLGRDVSLADAFNAANDVLLGAVQGIADLIMRPGQINVDFADVRTVMSEMGIAMMGSGRASGANRAYEAAQRALHSPLLDDINLVGARGILVNITAGPSLSLGEFTAVGETVAEFASESATVVVGTAIDPLMTDELRVTVVATGLGGVATQPTLTVIDTQRGEEPREKSVLQPPVRPQRPLTAGSQALKPQRDQRPQPGLRELARQEIDYLDIPAFLRRQAD